MTPIALTIQIAAIKRFGTGEAASLGILRPIRKQAAAEIAPGWVVIPITVLVVLENFELANVTLESESRRKGGGGGGAPRFVVRRSERR